MDLLIDKTRISKEEYVVVDVGAFHGYFAQEIIDKVPNVNITMMEANPHCEKYLKEIGKEYHIAVLSDKKKEKQSFYIRKGYETCTGASLYKENTEEYEDASVLEVNTSTLDEYELYPNGIDLLKIDVQGSELDVLKGSINTLTRVKNILVECSISEYNEGGAKKKEIIEYLDSQGFYPNEIIGEHWLDKGRRVNGKEVNGMNQIDILFTHDKNESMNPMSIKTFVINLKRREDRKERFNRLNSQYLKYEFVEAYDGKDKTYDDIVSDGFDTNKMWRDPLDKNQITKGGVGCFISHYKLWEKCIELNEPIFILEDDARILDGFNMDEIINLANEYNLIYAGYVEQKEDESRKIGKYQIPVYPYWASSYVITPDAAKILVEDKKNIIPVDEYIHQCINRLSPIGYRENTVDQGPHSRDPSRKKTDSDVDPNQQSMYGSLIDFNVHVCTIGKNNKTLDQSYSNNHAFDNLYELSKYIKTLPEHDVILYCGHDTIIADCLNQVVYRYLSFRKSIVFSADQYCLPDPTFTTLFGDDHYLNSSMFIGRVYELNRMFEEVELASLTPTVWSPKYIDVFTPSDDNNNQLFFQKKYLSGKFDCALDKGRWIFQNEDRFVQVKDFGYAKELYNQLTRKQPCIYNGKRASNLLAVIKNEVLKKKVIPKLVKHTIRT